MELYRKLSRQKELNRKDRKGTPLASPSWRAHAVKLFPAFTLAEKSRKISP
jgi:hypothetical protein